MYVCIQIILKHFLDKYFAPQKLNQKKQKENKTMKEKNKRKHKLKI